MVDLADPTLEATYNGRTIWFDDYIVFSAEAERVPYSNSVRVAIDVQAPVSGNYQMELYIEGDGYNEILKTLEIRKDLERGEIVHDEWEFDINKDRQELFVSMDAMGKMDKLQEDGYLDYPTTYSDTDDLRLVEGITGSSGDLRGQKDISSELEDQLPSDASVGDTITFDIVIGMLDEEENYKYVVEFSDNTGYEEILAEKNSNYSDWIDAGTYELQVPDVDTYKPRWVLYWVYNGEWYQVDTASKDINVSGSNGGNGDDGMGVVINAPDEAESGSEISFDVELTNTWTSGYDFKLSIYVNGDPYIEGREEYLGAGESFTESGTINIGSRGVTIEADADMYYNEWTDYDSGSHDVSIASEECTIEELDSGMDNHIYQNPDCGLPEGYGAVEVFYGEGPLRAERTSYTGEDNRPPARDCSQQHSDWSNGEMYNRQYCAKDDHHYWVVYRAELIEEEEEPGPSPEPDISITNISASTTSPTVGDTVTISITAKNNGDEGDATFDVVADNQTVDTVSYHLTNGETRTTSIDLVFNTTGNKQIHVGSKSISINVQEQEPGPSPEPDNRFPWVEAAGGTVVVGALAKILSEK